MLRNKMTEKFLLAGAIALSLTAFSCSPKASGVRAQVKTGQQNLDPSLSAISQQDATNQGVIYKINSVSIPNDVTAGQTVDVELITPSNQYLPLKTQHINGALETQGTYTDSVRGLQVLVEARCSANTCETYTLLLTVSKGGQKLFQTGAISYKDDCKFFSISIGLTVAPLFTNLGAFANAYNPVRVGDAASASCQ